VEQLDTLILYVLFAVLIMGKVD
ncbi:hypothetical protein SASC598J21_002320, partial [Snodgrassella alvi SCGC AB-598-J21]